MNTSAAKSDNFQCCKNSVFHKIGCLMERNFRQNRFQGPNSIAFAADDDCVICQVVLFYF